MVAPYAGEPADLSPYAKFAAPYDLNYVHPNIYSGAGRDIPDPKDVAEIRIGFFGPVAPNPASVFGQRMLHGAGGRDGGGRSGGAGARLPRGGCRGCGGVLVGRGRREHRPADAGGPPAHPLRRHPSMRYTAHPLHRHPSMRYHYTARDRHPYMTWRWPPSQVSWLFSPVTKDRSNESRKIDQMRVYTQHMTLRWPPIHPSVPFCCVALSGEALGSPHQTSCLSLVRPLLLSRVGSNANLHRPRPSTSPSTREPPSPTRSDSQCSPSPAARP